MKKNNILHAAFILLAATMILPYCSKNDSVSNENPLSISMKKVPALDMELVAGNFVSPIGLVAFPDNSNRLAVIDQIGKVWIINSSGTTLATPFIDVSSMMVTLSPGYDERGLLGLAFHPDYASNGKFYVYYNAPPRAGAPVGGTAWNNLSVISEFRVSASNANMADMTTERRLFEIDDPQSNHNGGTIEFGPDGYLYIAIGDGGGANDVAPGHVSDWYPVNAGGNAQNIEANWFGKMLRIDVNSGNPYSIPSDNPFVGKPGLDEIYAYGLRNPFRFSFDMGGKHDLIAGDAGQRLYEEINLISKGGNYGWNVKEGDHCFNAASNLTTFASCPHVDVWHNRLVPPVIELNNWLNPAGGKATTVIGGNVYRGQSIPALNGKYIFGTFSQSPTTANGELYMATTSGKGNWQHEEIQLDSSPNDIGYYLKGFGQDRSGEVYLTVSGLLGPSGTTGKVFKLVEAD